MIPPLSTKSMGNTYSSAFTITKVEKASWLQKRSSLVLTSNSILRSTCSARSSSAKIAAHSYSVVPDSIRTRARKQYAQLTALATMFEQHLAEGRHSAALECANQWRNLLKAVENGKGVE
jgi:hypothetical protein